MIQLKGVTKSYGTGSAAFTALDSVDLTVAAGEIAAVVGPSGAGKSTLSRCVNLLTRPTSGTVTVNGHELTHLDRRQLRKARQSIGTVFQGSNLLGRRTAAENIALPLEYLGVTRAATASRVGELLELVGLPDHGRAYPAQLSGGQRQRIGIARALALRPTVLLADEATSGLDPTTTDSILALIRSILAAENLSVILITHEMDVVRSIADTVANLEHGRIVESGRVSDLLTDPTSRLARQLLLPRNAVDAPPDHAVWEILLGAGEVALDWPGRLGVALGTSVSLLAASIESIGLIPIGRATIAIGPGLSAERVERALGVLGLHGVEVTEKRPASPRSCVVDQGRYAPDGAAMSDPADPVSAEAITKHLPHHQPATSNGSSHTPKLGVCATTRGASLPGELQERESHDFSLAEEVNR